MDLKEIMSISGMPGLYKVMANRTDGLIVEGLHDKVKKFVSSRQHMFTPLENITLYTTDDSIELKIVLSDMKKNDAQYPVPDVKKADDASLRAYMKAIVPNYDEEKVYASDIKKLIKWYELLNANQLISVIEEDAGSSVEEEVSENKVEGATSQEAISESTDNEEKPKEKKSSKKKTEVSSEEKKEEEKPAKATKAKKTEMKEDNEEAKPKKKAGKKPE